MVITAGYILVFSVSAVYAAVVAAMYAGLRQAQKAERSRRRPMVSVIVAVRNGEATIDDCLEHLFRQTYPAERLEIIVVDDHSSDATPQRLQELQQRRAFTVLRLLTNDIFASSKKAALRKGVEAAVGEVLLFTDADCTPPPRWVEAMVSYFTEEVGLTAGFSPQRSASVFWSNVLLIDAAAAAFAAAGGIGHGKGFTCTGRNLAVSRAAYEAVGGYEALPDTLSGDDDFMLQKISDHPLLQVRYAFDPNSVVAAEGPANVRMLLRQKQRHISAGRYYQRAKSGYALFQAANAVLWSAAAYGIFANPALLLPFALKLLIDGIALQAFLRPFHLRLPLKALLCWEPLFLFYHAVAGFRAWTGKTKWQ